MSTAVAESVVRTSAAVSAGSTPRSRAAMPAPCGDAAEVPKNGEPKPPTPVTVTPSMAMFMTYCYRFK